MSSQELIRFLNRIADMLQIKDESFFKVNAYRNAVLSISNLDEDFHDLYEQKRLDQIPGVGKAIREKIEEIIETGTCQYYERLSKDVPPGLVELLAIPGIGHKTVRLVYEALGITTIEQLYETAQNQQIRKIPGLGVKREEKIIKDIELFRGMQEKMTLGRVLPVARDLCAYLNASAVVEQVSPVGSVRRGKPLVGDLDILVSSPDESAVRQWIRDYPDLLRIEEEESGHIAGCLQSGIPFEIIIVPPAEYAEALFWTTGSKEHRRLVLGSRERSVVNNVRSEQELYETLNLAFIPPELRENKGEIETAGRNDLPRLVAAADLKGDLHAHSSWSDGSSSIAEMASAARSLGYEYLAITDHSQSLAISRGLTAEKLLAQATEIEQLNQQWDDFKILKGIEVDILKDGSLDLPDEVLQGLDIVIASVHSYFNLDKSEQTERIIRAVSNHNVDVIGHLTGRLLNRRPAYKLNIDRILEEAARNNTVLEINSHPDRLDIDENIARRAKDMGILTAVNSDAHHKKQLGLVHYGILTARRGWLEKQDLLNTLSLHDLLKRISR